MEAALSAVEHQVSSDMNASLIRPITDQEIKDAAFQLGSLKAPGPNGFSGIFYHKHWEVIGTEVCVVIKSFFRNGFLQEWNQTNIVLIPKVPHPEKLSQYRPISLCNFNIKIISKILANRLKLVL